MPWLLTRWLAASCLCRHPAPHGLGALAVWTHMWHFRFIPRTAPRTAPAGAPAAAVHSGPESVYETRSPLLPASCCPPINNSATCPHLSHRNEQREGGDRALWHIPRNLPLCRLHLVLRPLGTFSMKTSEKAPACIRAAPCWVCDRPLVHGKEWPEPGSSSAAPAPTAPRPSWPGAPSGPRAPGCP